VEVLEGFAEFSDLSREPILGQNLMRLGPSEEKRDRGAQLEFFENVADDHTIHDLIGMIVRVDQLWSDCGLSPLELGEGPEGQVKELMESTHWR
jgi:hypothetical protein